MIDEKYLFNYQNFLTDFDYQTKELIMSLVKNNLLVANRANIANHQFNSDKTYGFKCLVWLELGLNQHSTVHNQSYLNGLKGIWLAEKENGELLFLGEHKKSKSIGGRVLHQLNIFTENSSQFQDLIEQIVSVCIESERFKQFYNINYSNQFSLIGISQILKKLESIRVSKALNFFKSCLDSSIVELLSNDLQANISLYNYYISSNNTIRRNRLQAAKSYPFLQNNFIHNFQLKQCIDQGQQLQTAILSQFGIKKSTLKYLKKYAYLYEHHYLQNNLHILGYFTNELLPTTDEDIKAFCHHSSQLIELAKLLNVEPNRLAHPFIKGWAQGITNLENELNVRIDISRVVNMFDEIYQFILVAIQMKMFNQVVMPNAHRWFADWYVNSGLKNLLSLSNRWDKYYLPMQTSKYSSINYGQFYHWPALLTPSQLSGFYLPKGYYIVELLSDNSLKTEGEEMEHCVGSYLLDCLIDRSYIFSLRNDKGNSLTTFEIKFVNSIPEVIEHKAENNDYPNDFEDRTVASFKNYLEITINENLIKKNQDIKYQVIKKIRQLIKAHPISAGIMINQSIKKLLEIASFTYPKAYDDIDVINYFKQFIPQNIVKSDFDTQRKESRNYNIDTNRFNTFDFDSKIWNDTSNRFLNRNPYWCGYFDVEDINHRSVVICKKVDLTRDSTKVEFFNIKRKHIELYDRSSIKAYMRLMTELEYMVFEKAIGNLLQKYSIN